MRANFRHIAPLLAQADNVPGDFTEIGVWHGYTFVQMALSYPTRTCHAIDSFQGMSPPTDRDIDEHGNQQYLEGALSVGGSRVLRDVTRPYPNVRIHEGYVPAILDTVEIDQLAFAHVDLDHYKPTLDALLWCWQRLTPGGVLCSHDWFSWRDSLASGGANDFMRQTGAEMAGFSDSNHIWWVKP